WSWPTGLWARIQPGTTPTTTSSGSCSIPRGARRSPASRLWTGPATWPIAIIHRRRLRHLLRPPRRPRPPRPPPPPHPPPPPPPPPPPRPPRRPLPPHRLLRLRHPPRHRHGRSRRSARRA